MPKATAIAPMRTRAMAESLTLTRSTPASWSSRAASIVRSIRMERGGSISTLTTKLAAPQPPAQRRRRVAARRLPDAVAAIEGGGSWSGRRLDDRARGPRPRPLVVGRLDRVERGAHRGDVRRRRAAAAADDARPGSEQAGTTSAEVVRVGGVHEPALDPLRQAGVRQDRPREVRRRPAHPLQRVEAGVRPDAAVDADRVDAGRRQRRRRRLGRRAVDGARSPRRTSSGRRSAGRTRARASSTASSSSSRSLKVSRIAGRRRRPRAGPRSVRGRPPARRPRRGGAARGPGAPERADRPGDEHVPAGDVARLARQLGSRGG